MFVMRPANVADQPQIAEVYRERGAWMRDRGMHGWDGWHDRAEPLASMVTTMPMWALTAEGRVVGVTTVLDESPAWCWTEQERAEPALFLATTATHPHFAGQRLCCLIAWWALDHGHHTGHTWVRRGTGPYPGLARYYTETQGWHLVRTVERHGHTTHAFARRCQPIPELTGQLTTQPRDDETAPTLP